MSKCEVLRSESVSAQLSEHLLPLVTEEILICAYIRPTLWQSDECWDELKRMMY